ncbi:MAG: hypothetical protein ACRD8U_04655 [Pyrinomonadaceae bacterium]
MRYKLLNQPARAGDSVKPGAQRALRAKPQVSYWLEREAREAGDRINGLTALYRPLSGLT